MGAKTAAWRISAPGTNAYRPRLGEPAGARPIDAAVGKAELERALLAIDPFPRRALLLSVFEKLAIEDIGVLLNADRGTVKTATAIGLIEVARNLSRQGKSQGIGSVMASSMDGVQEMAV